MKKIMKRLCMLLMLVSVFWFVGTSESQVLAEESSAFFTEELNGITITSNMEAPSPTTQGKENYIFAGYYAEAECETPVTATTDQKVYAKFVPSKVLSVKAQLKADTTKESKSTNLRLVSSVDGLSYASVGFEIYYNNATKPVIVKTSTVYERIVASAESGVDYNYSSKVVGTESEYFVTATLLNINKDNFDKGFYIKPYWKTLDGTTVYGEGKYLTVNNGLDANNINVPVKVSAALNEASLSVTVAGTEYQAAVAKYDETYAYINITVENRNSVLKSLSKIEVTDGTTSGTAEYRNLMTKYTGTADTADTSWYDNSADTKKYIVATSADLYGIAKIANEGAASGTKDNFADKEIYVVADIAVNTETLITESIDANYTKWRSYNKTSGEYEYTTAPTYSWTPISEFAGKFYGEGHTISGLYSYSESAVRIAFIQTTLGAAELRNFKLVNSSFINGGVNHNANVGTASIVGSGSGMLDTIYSEALVDNAHGRTGGLVGYVTGGNFTMTNCWFNGTVTGRKAAGDTRTGGLIGHLEGTGNTINNCLNSGDVQVDVGTSKAQYVGGLIGLVQSQAGVNVQNSLNTGAIQITAGSSSNIGAILGIQNKAVLTNVYSTPSNGVALDDSNKVLEADLMGAGAQTALPAEFFSDGAWTTVNAHIPVLTSLKTAVIDDTWYDEEEDTFVLYDKADLYGLAILSQTNDFAGKTVELGDDIEVIAGNATTWGTTAARNMWIPIGNADTPFAGTFDGGLHTIRGLYLDTADRGGLFAGTTSSAVVTNLYLENSYFNNTTTETMSNIGSIAGVAQGTFNTIYSNAIVTGNGQGIGGLIGQSTGNLTMMNCWFAGNATSTREKDARLGGLIGTVTDGTTSTNFIYNCLNTGNVNASDATGIEVRVGGLIGHVKGSQSIQLKNSLNVGLVQYNEATSLFDGLIGATSTGTKVSNSYATTDSCSDFGTTVADAAVEKSTITGDTATTTMSSFDFTNIWQVVQDSTPTLNFVQTNQSFDTSWYNVAATEYVLHDKADLYGLAELSKLTNFAGKTIKLGKDIVVNTGDANTWSATNAPDDAWVSIGSSTLPFAGTFDGDMYSISGIYYKTDARYGGFFAATKGATISNFKLINSYFESIVVGNNADFAGLAAYANGTTFNTIYSDAIVVGAGQRGGGLVASFLGNSTMTNCWFDGSVTTNTRTSDMRSAGLVGSVTGGTENTITNCLNTGIVSAPKATNANARVGGLVGHVTTDMHLNMQYCLNTGVVNYNTATSLYGSIVGAGSSYATVTNTYATSASCAKTGVTQTASAIATIQGENAKTNLEGFDFDTTWTAVGGHTPLLTSFADLMIDTSWYYANTDADTFVLSDAKDLYGFASLSQTIDFTDKTIKLNKDITVNTGDADTWGTNPQSRVWIPIGKDGLPFAGTFDGQGYMISGLYLSTSGAGGLFGYTDTTASVMNVNLLNSYFNSTSTGTMSNIGSIAGVAKGTFQKIYSKATVVGNKQAVGGLLGQANNFTMLNCWFDGSVTGTNASDCRMGGLVGAVTGGTYSTNKIYNCLNTAPVNAPNADGTTIRTGGLVGLVASSYSLTLENSLNTGLVTVNTASATYDGLIGQATNANMKVINCYATIESCSDFGTATTGGTAVNKNTILGTAAKNVLKNFDFYTAWEVREDDTPILIMETVTLDEYIVRDAADLIAIATMSKTTNFAGKTIKLANNIDLTDVAWTPIGTSSSATRFAGTFDGQGYTISNLHMEATADYAGLFAATAPEAVVKNLIIANANISSTAKIAGIVAGLGHGTFSDIKVENATLTGGGRLGGLIGLAQNSVTLSNCSFGGTVTCVGADKENRYIGGLLGYATGGTLRISNCMNAGTIIGSAECTSDNPGVGGLVGCLNGVKSVAINSCVNVGTITVEATAAVLGVGPVIGRYTAPSGGFEMFAIEKCYTVPSKDLVGIDGIAEVTVDAVKSDAEAAMPLLDWTTQWESVDGNFPKVRFSQTGFVVSESLEVDSTSLTNLTTVYSASQVLKQGDIHSHAANGGNSDGNVGLETWLLEQMSTLDMDFAASLDHKQTKHIDLEIWQQNKDKLIYGTELGTNIHNIKVDLDEDGQIDVDADGEEIELGLHYNMIFTNRQNFENVLNYDEFRSKFDYYSGIQTMGSFKDPGYDDAEQFKRLIQAVQNSEIGNGFFVLAHPMTSPSYITAKNADTYLTPYLVDGMGIEVMYNAMNTTNVKNGYQIWKKTLKDGYRVYATAGTDTHDDLRTTTLTSFYAALDSDLSEQYLSEAYVRYLRAGNFTAGSVGIQMSVGDTQMGGTGSFEGAYLEVGIGALHKSVYDSSHKYRVDVWSEEGIMYSQPFTATTEDGQMTYLRTKADANCKYYRVEVYDVTTNTRIALGNPIWNSAMYQAQ